MPDYDRIMEALGDLIPEAAFTPCNEPANHGGEVTGPPANALEVAAEALAEELSIGFSQALLIIVGTVIQRRL